MDAKDVKYNIGQMKRCFLCQWLDIPSKVSDGVKVSCKEGMEIEHNKRQCKGFAPRNTLKFRKR